VPNIALNPTLDGIQQVVNQTAKAILQASGRLRCWGHVIGPATYVGTGARVMSGLPRPALCDHMHCTHTGCHPSCCCTHTTHPHTHTHTHTHTHNRYYDLIARDKEVVKSVLLLTGTVEGVKQQVAEYLGFFDKYAFLWTQDLQVRAGRARVVCVGSWGCRAAAECHRVVGRVV
jgi:dynein heavy chain